ncbi:MAG: uracil-DNA glycosylase [Mariprofundaceae bacterium]|nr:uracil-DNA glycosylase [Mariprofundaceae bacterium]
MKTPVSLLFCAPDIDIEASIENTGNHDVATATDLKALKQQALACEQCDLSSTGSKVIFGSGDEHADILCIGDVPHAVDDAKDHVFTGDSGILLDNMLKAIGLQREQVYVSHIIQCPTPDHRDPSVDEWEACQSWLQQKISLMQPKVILLMGRVAAQTVLQCDDALHDLRGQWHRYQDVPVRVIYHPAYLLRSPRQKGEMWKDLQLIVQSISV